MLQRNLIANFIGQGWTAFMGLAFVPIYVKILGIEAYGLVGFFALMQAWLTLLDMGMAPTLGREMARLKGGGHSAASIRDLLRSIEVLAFWVVFSIAVLIFFSSSWVAKNWVQAVDLPIDQVGRAIALMGFVAALRLLEGLYRSAVIGLQRQVAMNIVVSLMATLRSVGAVAAISWIAPTIEVFFIWQAVCSFLTLVALGMLTYASLPESDRWARGSISALTPVWKFAKGMIGVTLLSLLLMQTDKVILSRLLPLDEFGQYSLAATIAGALYYVTIPINQAFYPKLCELHAARDETSFEKTYQLASQIVSVVAGSIAIFFAVNSYRIVFLWTGDDHLSESVSVIASLVILGNLLNGLMQVPFSAQLAHGWTSLSNGINVLAILFVIPAIVWSVPIYGAVGAATVWLCLNLFYVTFGVWLMHRRILREARLYWAVNSVLKPLASATLVATGLAFLSGFVSYDVISNMAFLLISASIIFAVSFVSAPDLLKAAMNRYAQGRGTKT